MRLALILLVIFNSACNYLADDCKALCAKTDEWVRRCIDRSIQIELVCRSGFYVSTKREAKFVGDICKEKLDMFPAEFDCAQPPSKAK